MCISEEPENFKIKIEVSPGVSEKPSGVGEKTIDGEKCAIVVCRSTI